MAAFHITGSTVGILPPSTTAAKFVCDCPKCGFAVYENLVHFCPTAIKYPKAA